MTGTGGFYLGKIYQPPALARNAMYSGLWLPCVSTNPMFITMALVAPNQKTKPSASF